MDPKMTSYPYQHILDLQRQMEQQMQSANYPKTYISGGTYLSTSTSTSTSTCPSCNHGYRSTTAVPMSFEEWKEHGHKHGHLEQYWKEVLSEHSLEHPRDKVHLKPLDPIVVDKVDNIRMPAAYGNQGGSSSTSEGVSKEEQDSSKPEGPPEVEDKAQIYSSVQSDWSY